MIYPASKFSARSDRAPVDSELASFYAGTQFRTFKEITLAAGGSLVVKMTRPVDLVIRRFAMHVKEGEMRCEIYRGATPGGTWSDALPVIPKCELSARPLPIYQAQCSLASGGTTTGGTLYDLMHVKTAGASGQSATVGDDMVDALGIPKDSVGLYKFTNPGNSSTTCVFTMWWEEIVA